jgi:hypothetical protein
MVCANCCSWAVALVCRGRDGRSRRSIYRTETRGCGAVSSIAGRSVSPGCIGRGSLQADAALLLAGVNETRIVFFFPKMIPVRSKSIWSHGRCMFDPVVTDSWGIEAKHRIADLTPTATPNRDALQTTRGTKVVLFFYIDFLLMSQSQFKVLWLWFWMLQSCFEPCTLAKIVFWYEYFTFFLRVHRRFYMILN